jgi:hypothetical protein
MDVFLDVRELARILLQQRQPLLRIPPQPILNLRQHRIHAAHNDPLLAIHANIHDAPPCCESICYACHNHPRHGIS